MGAGDKVSNKIDDVGGKAKEAVGKLTDDKSTENEGKIDQAKTYYAQLVKDFGDTPSAAAAKEALAKLK